MSYIPETKTKEEFLKSFKNEGGRGVAKSAIKSFDLFCKDKYQKNASEVVIDLVKEVKNENTEKTYVLLSQFVDWTSIDHPEIIQRIGMNGSYKINDADYLSFQTVANE